jgi:hypothetical protein
MNRCLLSEPYETQTLCVEKMQSACILQQVIHTQPLGQVKILCRNLAPRSKAEAASFAVEYGNFSDTVILRVV